VRSINATRDITIGCFWLQLSLNDRAEYTEDVSDDEEGEQEDDDPDCPVVKLTKEEKKRMRKRWENTLIIKVLGKWLGITIS